MNTATQSVEIVAPSRLHFGMFSFGVPGVRQFGGVGAMIDRPGLRLRVERSEQFEVRGPLAARVEAVVDRVADRLQLGGRPLYAFEVLKAPPEHVGLGTGTQLTLAVTAAINAMRGGQRLGAAELAALSGRAERSAVGTYGFELGGLIVDAGKLESEAIAPLEQRVELPQHWRFVVTWPRSETGLAGEAERAAFRKLPAVDPATTAQLKAEASSHLLPAARAGDFARFADSLYRFGQIAGSCFAAGQGGIYASPRIARLVAAIRGLGVAGVGQSSWGPSVFALLESSTAADNFAQRLRTLVAEDDAIVIAPPNATGARIIGGPP